MSGTNIGAMDKRWLAMFILVDLKIHQNNACGINQ
jgi:hypothetical protein